MVYDREIHETWRHPFPAKPPFRSDISLVSPMNHYVDLRIAEFSQIPEERKEQLRELSGYVRGKIQQGQIARLTFICTHNSRRSHFAQIWAKAAAVHYGLDRVDTFSGGTEATAMNPRSVAALRRAGFEITSDSTAKENPRYLVHYSPSQSPEECFSKVYHSPPNPITDYCAVMTCSEADDACPTVHGADHRIAIPYVDPKVSDNTPLEAETYDERCSQIAREMLFVMSEV